MPGENAPVAKLALEDDCEVVSRAIEYLVRHGR